MLLLEMYCKAKALWLTRDRGATAAEYALIVAVIVGILAVAVPAFIAVVSTTFDDACTGLQGAAC